MLKALKQINWSLRLQQLFIIVAHLVLLQWMFYALYELGSVETPVVLMHFFGMAVYGALLIYGTAMWGKRQHRKEQQKECHENS